MINPNQNYNCDNFKCKKSHGEVRVLPYSKDGGNAILCYDCYLYEIAFRKERNLELAPDCRFDLPAWEDLKVY